MLWVKGGQTKQLAPIEPDYTCKVLIFMEGGKPDKNSRSTGVTNYNFTSHKF